jgi:hypothetical protein
MGRIAHQRAIRHPIADTGHQLYETPQCAVDALLRHEPLPFRIWEPCAGRGAISRVLSDRGYRVTAHDIMSYDGADHDIIGGHDFFEHSKAPEGCGCIVTNPPFKDADQFVRRALELVPKVVVLLRLAALEGAGRADIIEGHLTRLWIGIERLPMMHRDGWNGPKILAQAAPFAWFVFERQKWERDGFVGRRISWRG